MNEEAIKVYSLREWQIRISAAGGGGGAEFLKILC